MPTITNINRELEGDESFSRAHRDDTTFKITPLLAVLIGLVFGLGYLCLMPPFQIPDEASHFNRAVSVASGHCVAQGKTEIPRELFNFETAFPGFLERQKGIGRWVAKNDLTRWLHSQPSGDGAAQVSNPNSSLYSCLPYLPGASSLVVSRFLHLPPLMVLYAGRLANLASFLALIYASLHVMPDFRLHVLALAIMPMTLHQAASWSADALTLGTTFFLLAYILKLSFDPAIERIRGRQIALLGAAVLVCSLMKFNLWLVFTVALIPVARLKTRWHRWLLMGATVTLALACVTGWQAVNQTNTIAYLNFKKAIGIDITANTEFIRRHPALVLENMGASLTQQGGRLAIMFVGFLGWIAIPLPRKVVLAYLACLALLAATQTGRVRLATYQRLLLAVISAASILITFVLMFDFDTTARYIADVHRSVEPILSIQGRYFIPIGLLVMLVFSNRRYRVPSRVALGLTLLVSCWANASAYYLIYKDYYSRAYLKAAPVLGIRWPDGKTFLCADGVLHRITGTETLAYLHFHRPLVIGKPIEESVLVKDAFPALPGRVLRTADDPAIYFVDDGARHSIPNPTTQIALGLTEVQIVPATVMQAIPQGPALKPIAPAPVPLR